MTLNNYHIYKQKKAPILKIQCHLIFLIINKLMRISFEPFKNIFPHSVTKNYLNPARNKTILNHFKGNLFKQFLNIIMNILKFLIISKKVTNKKFFNMKPFKVGIICCRVLQNLYIGGTENVPAATICRTCFGPSELKLWQFLY
ncbi:hypothetical protein BpHYR1_053188 [Brachionus plicatilis]|uniref:Uncharacterized protein n=1 Tax=Brachionus plicatilis TaxID=10195 RepID=A0A3M7PQI1_BRAPC|nr:hypothetical protein BpHYR1_053188 [Brachionus plicatilis]